MNQMYNVSVRLNEDDKKKLDFLLERFSRGRIGKISQADILRYAIEELYLHEYKQTEEYLSKQEAEKAEKKFREKVISDQLKHEQAEKEQAEKEAKEKAEKEQAEKLAKEQAEKEKAEKEAEEMAKGKASTLPKRNNTNKKATAKK